MAQANGGTCAYLKWDLGNEPLIFSLSCPEAKERKGGPLNQHLSSSPSSSQLNPGSHLRISDSQKTDAASLLSLPPPSSNFGHLIHPPANPPQPLLLLVSRGNPRFRPPIPTAGSDHFSRRDPRKKKRGGRGKLGQSQRKRATTGVGQLHLGCSPFFYPFWEWVSRVITARTQGGDEGGEIYGNGYQGGSC